MTFYTVQNGDTLYTLAARCGTTVAVLARLNGLRPTAVLPIGQTLRLPCTPRPPKPDRPRPPQTTPPETDVFTYTVRPGDTLTDIARRFDTTVEVLARLNGLAEPDVLRSGQRLRIPSEPPSNDTYYEVQAGDTLYSIAAARGTTVEELVRLNDIAAPNLIFPGDRLRLP